MLNKINISHKEQILIVCIVLAAVTLAVFWQVNQYDFVFDDTEYVTNNSYVKSGITQEGFRWAFTTTTSNLWNPLVWLSLMLDYQVFGLNAGGYHMTNLILHILSTLLLFWLFNRMTRAIWESVFVAAFFAIHPLHVESVVWISERKDVLSAFFWILTLCLYVYYTEKPVIRRYLPVLFCFILALLSKPMVITLPIIMILLDYWPLGRFDLKQGNLILWQIKEKAIFFVLSVFFAVITIYTMYVPDAKNFPLSLRFANAPYAFVTYLEKTFWPYNMAAFYPFPNNISAWQVISTSLLIIVITIIVCAMIKRLPYLFVGWLWYLITILPVIGIIQNGYYAMADRYHYLPSIGITVMLVWGVSSLIKSDDMRRTILFPIGITALAILAVITWKQSIYWKNNIELWRHALQVTNNNYVAYNNLGAALIEEGKTSEAINYLSEAIRIKNDYCYAYNNRGNAYTNLGQHQRAIADYNKAIKIDSDYIQAYYNRGNAFNKLGQYQNAIVDYDKAILMKRDYADAYNNRGNAYTNLRQYQRSIADYNKAISLNPHDMQAYFNRVRAYLNSGDIVAGCRDAQKACELRGHCKFLEEAKSRGYCR